MTTKAATEEALGELHGKVAKVMSNALDVAEKAQEVYLEAEGEDIGPPPEVPASLMSVITKFLADNKISCVPAESQGVSALEQRLKNKNRRSVGNVVHLDNAE